VAKSPSHIPRTLAWLRARGALAAKTEQWVAAPWAGGGPSTSKGFRRDLLGLADVIAVFPGVAGQPRRGTTYIQVGSAGAGAEKERTALALVHDGIQVVSRLLDGGNEVVIFLWRRRDSLVNACPACAATGQGRRKPTCSRCSGRGWLRARAGGWEAETRELVVDGGGIVSRPWARGQDATVRHTSARTSTQDVGGA
jgi:hypothetical protein